MSEKNKGSDEIIAAAGTRAVPREEYEILMGRTEEDVEEEEE